jgi:hypothetical protein
MINREQGPGLKLFGIALEVDRRHADMNGVRYHLCDS